MVLEYKGGSKEKLPFGTRFLALINLLCPACNIARRFPRTPFGRIMARHWEKGCSTHRAYLKVYKRY
jgi:hypothetical protein